jgi:hypothetical protein
MCIGTDDIECCQEQFFCATRIGRHVTGSFHDQFEVICELKQMVEIEVMT